MGIFGLMKKKVALRPQEAMAKAKEITPPPVAEVPAQPPLEKAATPAPSTEEKPKHRLTEGPLFVSLEKFREVKAELNNLKKSAEDVRMALEDLKANRSVGQQILEESSARLADIEGRLELVTKTLRLE